MIDWDFIQELEGRRLSGYVPDPTNSHSGVTVASGVDLGQITSAELAMLPAPLQAKLLPFVGLQKLAAVSALQRLHGLTITAEEAHALDMVVEGANLAPLRASFRACGVAFDQLPDAVQTVAASVAFQYGNVQSRCPHFWRALVSQDTSLMVEELDNFGDQYETRRHREAAYLQEHLSANDGSGRQL